MVVGLRWWILTSLCFPWRSEIYSHSTVRPLSTSLADSDSDSAKSLAKIIHYNNSPINGLKQNFFCRILWRLNSWGFLLNVSKNCVNLWLLVKSDMDRKEQDSVGQVTIHLCSGGHKFGERYRTFRTQTPKIWWSTGICRGPMNAAYLIMWSTNNSRLHTSLYVR